MNTLTAPFTTTKSVWGLTYLRLALSPLYVNYLSAPPAFRKHILNARRGAWLPVSPSNVSLALNSRAMLYSPRESEAIRHCLLVVKNAGRLFPTIWLHSHLHCDCGRCPSWHVAHVLGALVLQNSPTDAQCNQGEHLRVRLRNVDRKVEPVQFQVLRLRAAIRDLRRRGDLPLPLGGKLRIPEQTLRRIHPTGNAGLHRYSSGRLAIRVAQGLT